MGINASSPGTELGDYPLLGVMAGIALYEKITTFLATNPISRGTIDGINIALGNGTTVGGMNRIDAAIDDFLDRY